MRNKIEQTVTRLLSEVKGIRIAIFAHGDYQDKPQTYDTKWLDFTSDEKAITSFVKNVSSTCGYDSDECYELVLRQVLEYYLGFLCMFVLEFYCGTTWRICKYYRDGGGVYKVGGDVFKVCMCVRGRG